MHCNTETTSNKINAQAPHLEAILSCCEALEEVLHDGVSALLTQAVKHKLVTNLQPTASQNHKLQMQLCMMWSDLFSPRQLSTNLSPAYKQQQAKTISYRCSCA
jgi:hypothetical protein